MDFTGTFSIVGNNLFFNEGAGARDHAAGIAGFATQGNFSPVPEPSTYALLGFGMLAIGFGIRRQKLTFV
ncbi:MAG: PEP-CTERM sorting domain-containing protein [Chthoniobacterales bacterium]